MITVSGPAARAIHALCAATGEPPSVGSAGSAPVGRCQSVDAEHRAGDQIAAPMEWWCVSKASSLPRSTSTPWRCVPPMTPAPHGSGSPPSTTEYRSVGKQGLTLPESSTYSWR